MQRNKGLISAILTSIACVHGLFWALLMFSGDKISLPPVNTEGLGEMGMIFVLLYGSILAALVGILLVGAHVHGLCLVFNIRGYRAPHIGIRVWHVVLSALNSTVIVLYITRLVLWYCNGMVQ